MARLRAAIALFAVSLVAAACTGPASFRVKETATLGADAKVAPGFTAVDHRGQPVSLAAALREGPVALVFYRGHW